MERNVQVIKCVERKIMRTRKMPVFLLAGAIFLSALTGCGNLKYDMDYHLRAFGKMAGALDGYTETEQMLLKRFRLKREDI